MLPRVVSCSYENIVQIRCLYEGVTVDDMLSSWHDMLPQKMQEWGLDRGQVGGSTRWALGTGSASEVNDGVANICIIPER